MSEQPCVLLLSHSQEPFCTERVAGALRERGVRALRIDTDEYPQSLPLRAELGPGRRGPLLLGDEPLVVDAVWLWRLWPPRRGEQLTAPHREAAARESTTALRGLLDLLTDAPWIDAIDVVRAADNKTRQLRLAQAVGLVIPPTLISADPASVRRFHAEHAGQVVAKLQTSLGYAMTGGAGLATRMLTTADLEALDGLRHCPMVFQRYIPKFAELRIAWVDGRALTGALAGAECGVDWRHHSTASWQHHALPGDIHARLAALMARLGLRQGAIDMIVTPGGEHVLLEVNPTGEWGMLERDLGLPISAALADALHRLATAHRSERTRP
jgi:glutathione synthase/RimK-type ligase-like ATP-grasp enzyme